MLLMRFILFFLVFNIHLFAEKIAVKYTCEVTNAPFSTLILEFEREKHATYYNYQSKANIVLNNHSIHKGMISSSTILEDSCLKEHINLNFKDDAISLSLNLYLVESPDMSEAFGYGIFDDENLIFLSCK